MTRRVTISLKLKGVVASSGSGVATYLLPPGEEVERRTREVKGVSESVFEEADVVVA